MGGSKGRRSGQRSACMSLCQCHLLKPFGLVRCRTEQCCADQEGVHLGRRLEMDHQRPGGVMSDRTKSSTSATAQTISDLRK